MGKTVFTHGAMLLVAVFISLQSSGPARAEPQKLALPQIVEFSLQNNGDLKSFREEKGLHDAGKVRAALLPNPTLDVEAGTGVLTGSSAENSLSIGISQEFPLAGKRAKRLTIAAEELQVYRWQLADRERIVREEVKNAFHAAIFAARRFELAERAVELNRQLLDVTKERLAAGDIPELEMNLVKVELARSEGARIDIARAVTQSRARLYNFMGLPGGEAPVLTGTLEAEVPLSRSLDELQQLARENRPDLKALQAERKRGEADTALARAEGVPNLTAGVAFRRDTTAMEIGGVEGKDTAYTIGLKLSLPIPLFDRNQAGVQQALARRSSTESRLLAVGRNVEREVETACSSYLNSEKILSLYKRDIIPQLEENLQLTREAYRLGEVGILAVIAEQKKFYEVNEAYLLALHDRQTALVRLESAVASDLTGGAQ